MFGLLSGKIRRDAPQPTEGRLAALGAPIKVTGSGFYRIVDVMLEIAPGAASRQLRWLSIGFAGKPGVDTVILGARNEEQLRDKSRLGCVGIER